MASIGIRENRIYFNFRYNGKRFRVSTGMQTNRKNMKLAENRLRFLESELMAEKMGGRSVDFSQFFPGWRPNGDGIPNAAYQVFGLAYMDWLENQSHISKSTDRAWRSAAKNYLLPVLRDLKVQEVKMKHISRIITEMKKKNLKNSTIIKAFVPLKSFFYQMVDDDIIEKYPIKRFKGLRVEKTDIVPFNTKELKALFGSIKKKFSFFYLFFRFLLLTGCRPSEVIALKWERIDWDNKLILIREGRVLGVTTPLKTKSSIRDLEMRPELKSLLLEQKKKTAHLNSEHVFPNTLGHPICWENVRQKYHRALKASGVKPRRAYQLRHTFASLALKAGEDIAWVSKTLGHANIKTTLDKYARFIPDKGRKDGGKFRSMLEEGE